MNITKIILSIGTIFFLLMSLLLPTACDKRKDRIAELEEQSLEPPKILIKRFKSANPLKEELKDTFLLGINGYRLGYELSGNYDKSTLKMQCLTNCDSLVSISIISDSSYFRVFTKTNSTVSFELSVKDFKGNIAKALFTLTFKNSRPVIGVRPGTSSGPYFKSFLDTCKYSFGKSYTFAFSYNDDNSSSSAVKIIKGTSNDPAIITTSGTSFNLNYGALSVNKIFVYKVYANDILGAVSDTSYVTVIYNNYRPKFFISKTNSNFGDNVADSMKTTLGINYNLTTKIIDEDAVLQDVIITKLTPGDNSITTFNLNKITFNYQNCLPNKSYNYKMYLIDKQGAYSDTVDFKVYVFKNRPPVFISMIHNPIDTTKYFVLNSNIPYLSNSCYWESNNTLQNVSKRIGSVLVSDIDGINFNGFVTKVKYKFIGNYSKGCGSETIIYNTTNTSSTSPTYNSSYNLYRRGSRSSFPNNGNPLNDFDKGTMILTIYDNDGDSTVTGELIIPW